MISLRQYKPGDAETIVEWCKDKETFQNWGGKLIGEFPLSEVAMNHVYLEENGHCKEADNFYPMTAFDENGIVGHFIMRYIHGDKSLLRFGWVIVDGEKRGHGIGREMLKLGLKQAFEVMGARKVTLGVYENNVGAYKCYLSAGFHGPSEIEDHIEKVDGEERKVIELEITREEWENRAR